MMMILLRYMEYYLAENYHKVMAVLSGNKISSLEVQCLFHFVDGNTMTINDDDDDLLIEQQKGCQKEVFRGTARLHQSIPGPAPRESLC